MSRSKTRMEVTGELRSALASIARELQRPIGLVEDSSEIKPCQIGRISVASDGLEDALDSIVSQCASYTWQREGESVFLLPRRAVRSPLNLSIRSFSIQDETLEQAQSLVMNLPEVRQWMKANGIRVFDLESPARRSSSEAKISLSLSGVGLHEVLDAVARASGKMVWRILWFDHDTSMGIYL